MIRALIFDFFGVICGPSFEHIQSLTPQEKLTELEDLRMAHDRGYVGQAEFFETISVITGVSQSEIAEIMRSRHILNQVLIDEIIELKKQYKTGLLTNIGPGWIDEVFPPHLQPKMFDEIVQSCDVHMIKPQPEIYEYTAHKLGFSVEECLMIDDMEKNIKAAHDLGMSGIVFTSVEKMNSDLAEHGVKI